MSYKIKVFPIKSGADVYINPKVDVYDLHPSLNSLTLKFLDANTFYDFEIMAVNKFGEGVSEKIVGSEYIFSYTLAYAMITYQAEFIILLIDWIRIIKRNYHHVDRMTELI